MISPFQWLANRYQSVAKHFTYEFIDSTRVTGRTIGTDPLRSGEHYYRLTLAEMFLQNKRKWFTEWTPAVYSLVKFQFGNSEVTASHVAGPTTIEALKDKTVQASVTLNYPLTPLTPFNGGDIEIDVGLTALPGRNDLTQLLQVLGDFSKVLAVPQISTALTFAQPLVGGIQSLVGADDTQLALRLHDSFTQGSTLKPGYLGVVAKPSGSLVNAKLSVKNDRLLYDGSSLTDTDYMLLRVDSFAERDDYHALSSIDQPFQAAIKALGEAAGEFEEQARKTKLDSAERYLAAAKLAAYNSPELTYIAGRRQVIDALSRRFAEAKQVFAPGAAPRAVPGTLEEIMQHAMPVSDAVAMGAISLSELDL
jgi:hypothetical protein